jgi:sugar phosphate isomerase/epimerase
MSKCGIVSISFRKHSAQEILEAAKKSGLEAIEWGGDVHVPHGDTERAENVKALTEKYGISIPEYGSYYVISESEPELFEKVLASARALGTSVIRVWPGKRPSDSISEEDYEGYVADAKRICDLAPDMTIALECHPNSLTDEYHTALKLLSDVERPNLKMFWQPNQHRSLEYNIDSIRALLPYIVSIHVFSWVRKKKYPLAYLEDAWRKYIDLLSGKDRNYMLEFMHDDDIETLEETAKVLKAWLKK